MFVDIHQARFLFCPKRCRLLDEGRKASSHSLINGMHDFEERDISRKEFAAHSRIFWCFTHSFVTKSQQADAHRFFIVFCFFARTVDCSTLEKDLSRRLGWIGDTCCGNEAMWGRCTRRGGVEPEDGLGDGDCLRRNW